MAVVELKDVFKTFATKANNTEMTSTDFTRWCKDAGIIGKSCNSNHIDISFSKVKGKDRNLLFAKLDMMLTEMAKKHKDDINSDEEEAKKALISKLAAANKQLHGTTKTQKVGGVEKLTDTTQYTGAHKQRFDEDGKGRGIDGREDRTK